jgi:hypothetical protein
MPLTNLTIENTTASANRGCPESAAQDEAMVVALQQASVCDPLPRTLEKRAACGFRYSAWLLAER